MNDSSIVAPPACIPLWAEKALETSSTSCPRGDAFPQTIADVKISTAVAINAINGGPVEGIRFIGADFRDEDIR